jgi:hypothetical protein
MKIKEINRFFISSLKKKERTGNMYILNIIKKHKNYGLVSGVV